MTEVLSQEEIDDLLRNINGGGDLDSSSGSGVSPSLPSDYRKVRLYDFKKPSKFSKEQLRSISIMHESFARSATTSLSTELRSLVSVHVVTVDELTYEEFTRSIPTPTTLAIINMDPLKNGSAILEIDPTITFVIIDRLLGGKGELLNVNRELTEIEKAVIESIIVRLLGNMRDAWSNVVDLRPRLSQIEDNPQFAQIVSPTEMVILVTLEIRLGENEGMLNFCFPYIALADISSKLSTFWHASIEVDSSHKTGELIKNQLSAVNLDVIAEIGKTKLTVSEISTLKPGDIINLIDANIKDPFIVRVGKKIKFEGYPGIKDNKSAIQISKKVDDLLIDVDDYLETERGGSNG